MTSPKNDVTFDENIKSLLSRNQAYLIADIKTNTDITVTADLTDYNQVINDDTCKLIYDSLKRRRRKNENNDVSDSNEFATWIYEGRRENLANSNKIAAFAPNRGNQISYGIDIRPLFTDCDEWNMKQQTRGGLDIQLFNYENVKTNSENIFKQVKQRNMPPGAPWTDKEINTFSAWVFDGCFEGTIAVYSPIKPYYPEDIEIGDDGYPKNPDQLNFNDHVSKMFTYGHRQRMIEHDTNRKDENPKYPDMRVILDDYKSVVYHKINILDRLTWPTKGARMPKNNPWPIKNIKLFHAWAKQGKDPKESKRSTIKPYDQGNQGDQEDLKKMQGYVDRYPKDPLQS